MIPYRLFHSPGACSLATHILLEELGVPYEPLRVVVANGDQNKPEYLAINPRGRVPTLAYYADGKERYLTESVAIMVFLAQRHPESGFLPEGPDALSRALEWMCWLTSTMHQAGVRTVLRPERFTTDPSASPGIRKQGQNAIITGYRDIERRLIDGAWALGERYSIVDMYLLVFYRWGNRSGINMRNDFPAYARLMDAVRARPAVAHTIKHENIQIE